MDTPKIPAPKDEGEKEILDNMINIRDELQLRKLDRSTYVRTQDVMVLYDRTIDQVKRLNEIRHGKAAEENRVDRVVDSCFQLLSLFFMTIGRNNEAPAAYALTSTIRRLLDHLTEADLFSAKDLESMSHTLDHLSEIVHNASNNKSAPFLETLLANRISRCRASLNNLQQKLEEIAEPLRPTVEKLVSVLRQMAGINTRSKFNPKEIHKLRGQLDEINAKRVDGNFVDENNEVLAGSDKVSELLDRNGELPEKWMPLYKILVGIRNELDKLSLTQAWSLRETDLYDYQRQLDKIDESRVDGNWIDDEGQPAELYAQRTLLYLIRRSYGYIYHLMISSEPVSEALLPVYNQLQTLKRCLMEVKENGGVSSLNSLDDMRVDGKFMVGDDVPEGQAAVTELLAECFDLNYELRLAVESESGSPSATPAEDKLPDTQPPDIKPDT
ncbi:hypothetical protein DL766_001905 [Monosporascus sp. MC13-8B]|uniref:Uncharacterized protein n=1 Tax=Monosporascus cannonballus TaxID=155416 RepID=A0ABY0HI32_9PEZI|nr:hypothetical protein DL763_004700 [Monosporascus cannonballus]RYO93978.1 hypothetical protein DL762_000726 [Monosporascus cannonballus]RYP36665.1 hypothetical protein DL766_001905 [Monosporascus sp. MC13-8B]